MRIQAIAPTRISLIGGGTDLPVFYEKHGGAVISMAINLRQKIELSKFKIGYDNEFPMNSSPIFYETFFREFDEWPNVNAQSDAPIQSGLGSSASAAVALVASLARLKGQKLTKEEIVDKAWTIEVERLKLYGGKQDQIAAVYGGFNHIEFGKHGFKIKTLDRELSEFWSKRILLFFTGKVRKNTKIQDELKTLSEDQIKRLKELSNNVFKANYLIHARAVKLFATLLKESWETKKKINPLVTTNHIDNIYNKALQSGALAGKLLGSGGGGFMAFLVEPENQDKVIDRLEKIEGVKHYDFSIDYNGLEVREL